MWQGAQECAFAMAPDAGPVRHPRAQYRCKRFSMVDCRVLVMSHDSWLVCRKPCTDLVALHHPPPGYISFDWPQLVSAPVLLLPRMFVLYGHRVTVAEWSCEF